MNSDLEKSLQNIAEKEAKIAEEKAQVKQQAINEINALVALLGIKSSEINWGSSKKAAAIKPIEGNSNRKVRGSVPPKYRSASGETWTGRGKKPHWVQTLEQEGGNLDDYLIEKPQSTANDAQAVQTVSETNAATVNQDRNTAL